METNRRTFIKTTAVLGAGVMAATSASASLLTSFADTQFALPKLPYSFDALEPYIDAATMEIHYSKHHKAYVDKLNDAAKEDPSIATRKLESVLADLSSVKQSVRTAVRNNGGGHWNHSFFWKNLKKGTMPGGSLKDAINRDFNDMQSFTAAFEKAATSQFGSGWAWLISNNGKLSITSTPNQDNPLMQEAVMKGTPVIALDVWEHAYYLKYQNKRADYIKAFWNVVNWEEAEKNYKG